MVDRRNTRAKRAEVFAALGDPIRLTIAEELSRSDRTPGELIELTEISSALLAHHLDVLEAAGVVQRTASHADGRKRFVRLLPQHRAMLAIAVMPRDVVFVCTHNSARSQLAAALWSRLTGQRARSAGTQPADQVHSLAIDVAQRNGIDLRGSRPRPLGAIGRTTTLITVCDQAHDELAAPLQRLHWSIADPVKVGTTSAFDRAFDELYERIDGYPTKQGALSINTKGAKK